MRLFFRATVFSLFLSTTLLAVPSKITLAKSTITTPPKITYITRLQNCIKRWNKQLSKIEQSAETAAQKVIDGGQLYVAGPQESFWHEARGRAGGLMLTKHYIPGKQKLTKKDTVLLAVATNRKKDDTKTIKKLHELLSNIHSAKAQAIIFASGKNSEIASDYPKAIFLNNKIKFPTAVKNHEARLYSVSNIIGMWTWTASFISSCTNQGKMPCVYESYGMPGSRQRATFLSERNNGRFHKATTVTSKDTKNLDRRYLKAVSQALGKLSQHQFKSLQQAAIIISKAHKQGKLTKVYYLGHMFPEQINRSRSPKWIVPTARTTKAGKFSKKDVVLVLGYESFPWSIANKALKNGNPCIITSSGAAPTEFTQQPGCVYIKPYWSVNDAALNLNHYDISILPISGIMQAAVYWQIVGMTN